MLFFMGSGHRKGHSGCRWHPFRVCRCILSNRRSTVSQPLVNLVNLHDAWQWDSGFAFTHHAGIGFATFQNGAGSSHGRMPLSSTNPSYPFGRRSCSRRIKKSVVCSFTTCAGNSNFHTASACIGQLVAIMRRNSSPGIFLQLQNFSK